MATFWRLVRRTQTAGLVATGAAVGYYFISPSLRVEEIRVPSSSLLATAPMFGIGDKKMAKVYNTDPYRDCFAVTVPKEVLAESCKAAAENGGTAKTPQDIMMSYARSFMTSPVFKVERAAFKYVLRSRNSLSDQEIHSSDLPPGLKLDSFQVVDRTDKELLLKWQRDRNGQVTAGYTWLGIAPSQPPPPAKGAALAEDSYWDSFKKYFNWGQQSAADAQPSQEAASAMVTDTLSSYWNGALHKVGLGPWASGSEATPDGAAQQGDTGRSDQEPGNGSVHSEGQEVLDGSKSVRLMFGSAFWHVSPAGKVTAEPNQQVVSWPVTIHKWYSKLLLGSAADKLEHQLKECG